MRRIFHVDLDSFFVSVERVLDPSLEGRPVAVGGDPEGRGVVSCASYEARRYGLHAGMPLSQARRLCPQAVFIRGSFGRYEEFSRGFHGILGEYTPFLEPLGLDESFMDTTGFESLYGPLAALAETVRGRIRGELGITASVGIAGCKAAAKVASDACKPDGVLEVPPGWDAAFLAPLPVEMLSGIGPRSVARLRGAGIATLGELAATPPANLRRLFGAWGDLLHRRASGRDDSPVAARGEAKSYSRETTFPHDTLDPDTLRGTLRRLAERVGADLRRDGKEARRVFLKLRWADFTTVSRQVALRRPTDGDDVVYTQGLALLRREMEGEATGRGRAVRLIGIGVAELTAPDTQLPLWPAVPDPGRPPSSSDSVGHPGEPPETDGPADGPPARAPGGQRRLDRALDAIRRKHGAGAVQRGLVFHLRSAPRPERGRDAQGPPGHPR